MQPQIFGGLFFAFGSLVLVEEPTRTIVGNGWKNRRACGAVVRKCFKVEQQFPGLMRKLADVFFAVGRFAFEGCQLPFPPNLATAKGTASGKSHRELKRHAGIPPSATNVGGFVETLTWFSTEKGINEMPQGNHDSIEDRGFASTVLGDEHRQPRVETDVDFREFAEIGEAQLIDVGPGHSLTSRSAVGGSAGLSRSLLQGAEAFG